MNIQELLVTIYGPDASRALSLVQALQTRWQHSLEAAGPAKKDRTHRKSDNKDVVLITYSDSIRKSGEIPLASLKHFLMQYAQGVITNVHLLPLNPSSSDDGFSVADYTEVDPELGSWKDVEALAEEYGLMLDAVINHSSVSNPWFHAFLSGDERFANHYIRYVEGADYSKVVRPRTSPLFTEFEGKEGPVKVWTTFSADQVDLNFAEPQVLADILDVLLFYASKGARFIRLDAVGFIWKETGSTCMHLPQAHAIVKLARLVLSEFFPGIALISETNVPHAENISYFGSGDEAALVYQFPLPPLVLHSFISGDGRAFSLWAASLNKTPPPKDCTYFNFLASHDGIGLRPTEGILSDAERSRIAEACLSRGGFVNYRNASDGSKLPYELNINYMDALSPPGASDEKRLARMLAAHALLFSMPGIPAVYIHSLLGSRNWRQGALDSGINRRINRAKLDFETVASELADKASLRRSVLDGLRRLASARSACPAMLPEAELQLLEVDSRLVAYKRILECAGSGKRESLLVIVNLSEQKISWELDFIGRDLIGDAVYQEGTISIAPLAALYLERC